MKKTLLVLVIIATCLPVISGCRKKPAQTTQVITPSQQKLQPALPPADQLGEQITFELTYRGSTGEKDDVGAYSFYGFGDREEKSAPFVKEVLKKIDNKYVITECSYFEKDDRKYVVTEYKEGKALAVYFDLDADGRLAQSERIEPVTNTRNRGDNEFDFVTPDFTLTTDGGKIPFRILIRVSFYGDTQQNPDLKPSIMMSSMGMYEGTAKIGDQKYQMYLFSNLYSQTYIRYSDSRYALVPTSRNKEEWFNRSTLSSLITHEGTFYRVTVEGSDAADGSLKVHLYEDKTPRGKLALKIQGKDGVKSKLSSANLQGVKDKTIYFNVADSVEKFPIGEYVISYGNINYGKEDVYDYSTSFRNIPAFTIKEDNTVTVEIGSPKLNVQAVELNKRYHSNKQYKTEFPEGTAVYIDAAFTGITGETYGSFNQRVQKEDYITSETIKARIRMVDDKGNEVVSQDLEYG